MIFVPIYPRTAMVRDSLGDYDYYYDSNSKQISRNADQSGGKWCVISIAGNKTIVLRRKDDFITYFRMNVASLTGSEYDDVIVNAITYTPQLIVNATLLRWEERSDRIVSVLSALARHNDTLLDLSGVHFNVTHFASSEMLMAPKPVAPYMIGTGIDLDNEVAEDKTNTESNLRLMNTNIDSSKIEAMIFVIVGVAIAFLLTASLFFAACQCIYRNKTTAIPPEQHRKSQLSLLEEEQMRRARRSSTYSTSIHHSHSRKNSFDMDEFNREEIVSGRSNLSRMSSPISVRSYSKNQHEDRPKMIYSPDFSKSIADTRLGMQMSEEERLANSEQDNRIMKISHSVSNGDVAEPGIRRSCYRRSLPNEGLDMPPLSRSRESLSSSGYNNSSEYSYFGQNDGAMTLRPKRGTRFHHHPEHSSTLHYRPHRSSGRFNNHRRAQPKRPASVASTPINRNAQFRFPHNSDANGGQFRTFRNDPVPTKYEPKFSGHLSDVADLIWTDTEDEANALGQMMRPNLPFKHQAPNELFLSTFRPIDTDSETTTSTTPLQASIQQALGPHDQPLSQSMITSPVLIPPPSSPPIPDSSLLEADKHISPPLRGDNFTIPTPEEIKKDVDLIFKNMGLDAGSDVLKRDNPDDESEHVEMV